MTRWASAGVFAWCLRLEFDGTFAEFRRRAAATAGPDYGPHSEHGIPELRRSAGRLMEHVRR